MSTNLTQFRSHLLRLSSQSSRNKQYRLRKMLTSPGKRKMVTYKLTLTNHLSGIKLTLRLSKNLNQRDMVITVVYRRHHLATESMTNTTCRRLNLVWHWRSRRCQRLQRLWSQNFQQNSSRKSTRLQRTRRKLSMRELSFQT